MPRLFTPELPSDAGGAEKVHLWGTDHSACSIFASFDNKYSQSYKDCDMLIRRIYSVYFSDFKALNGKYHNPEIEPRRS